MIAGGREGRRLELQVWTLVYPCCYYALLPYHALRQPAYSVQYGEAEPLRSIRRMLQSRPIITRADPSLKKRRKKSLVLYGIPCYPSAVQKYIIHFHAANPYDKTKSLVTTTSLVTKEGSTGSKLPRPDFPMSNKWLRFLTRR